MADVSTKYVLDFDQKGIPKAEAEQKKFGDTLDKTFSRASKQVSELEKRFESLRKTMIKCSGDFAKAMEKGFDTRRVVRQMQDLNKELAKASRYAGGGGGGGGGGSRGGSVPFDTTMDSQFGPAIAGGGGGGGGGGFSGGGGRGGGGGGSSGGGGGFGNKMTGMLGSLLTGGGIGALVGGGIAGAIFDRAASPADMARNIQRQQYTGMPYLGAENMRPMRQRFDAATQGASNLGMNASDVLGYRTQVAAASGLSHTETANQGLDYLGMAAGARYGIGASQVGAFVQAGAVGGSRDGGSGGEQMVNAINQGLSMALKGSDLQAFLGQIAGDITAWKQTGIEVSPSSMGALGREMAQTGGMGNVRGAYSAQQASDTYRQIGQQGAQSPEQFELLQRMGASGGDPMSILHQQRLATRPENQAGMAKMARQELEDIVRRSSNDDVAFAAVTNAAPKLGYNLGPGEAEGVIDSARGRGGGRRKRIVDQQRGAKRTSALGIHNEAASSLPEAVRTDAEQQNVRIGTGENTSNVMQGLGALANTMADGAGKIVTGMETAATALGNFAKRLDKTIDDKGGYKMMKDLGMYGLGDGYAKALGGNPQGPTGEVTH